MVISNLKINRTNLFNMLIKVMRVFIAVSAHVNMRIYVCFFSKKSAQ
jgi:hypothetical protein